MQNTPNSLKLIEPKPGTLKPEFDSKAAGDDFDFGDVPSSSKPPKSAPAQVWLETRYRFGIIFTLVKSPNNE